MNLNPTIKSKVIIVVGRKGVGKSTFIRSLTMKANIESLFIYDHNFDHQDYYKKPFLNFPEFAELSNKIMRGIIVYEEATIFLGHMKNFSMQELLVSSRRRENTVILVFHSLRSVPRYIYDLGNFIVLFKTNDEYKFVNHRFESPDLLKLFESVKKNSNPYYYEILEYA